MGRLGRSLEGPGACTDGPQGRRMTYTAEDRRLTDLSTSC